MPINRPLINIGTTALEVLLLILCTALLTIIATYLSNFLVKREAYIKRFILEFIVILLPEVMVFTILALEEILIGVMIMLDIIALSCVFLAGRSPKRHENHQQTREIIANEPICYLANTTSMVNLSTGIAILAVDFYIFPNRLCATTVNGFSFVDLGVGLFVCANGIVAPELLDRNHSYKKMMLAVLPIFFMGVAKKMFDVLMSRAPHPDFGTFWNAFFSMGTSKFVSSCIVKLTGLKMIAYVGVIIIIIHEILLQIWILDLIIAPKIVIPEIILDNWSSICSLLGYVSLYTLSMALGRFIHLKNRENPGKFRIDIMYYLLCIVIFSLLLSFCAYMTFHIMAKPANSTYCLWVHTIGSLIITLFYTNFAIQDHFFGKGCMQVPIIFEAINYNGLFFYIIASVVSGMANLNWNLQYVSAKQSLLAIYFYLFITCSLSLYLYRKQIKFLSF